jgi:1-acyl-sn-glycerol-3-phosphate acyltransferase
MIVFRSVVFNILFYTTFIILMVGGSPLMVSRRWTFGLVRFWARASLGLLDLVCGIRVEFRNLHLLPQGGSILAVKHQSFLETFALITVLDDFTYILKRELTWIPLFGWYLKVTGQIAIDRSRKGSVIQQLIPQVRRKLATGRQIVIFPEGTRRPVDGPAVYKSGVAMLCAAAAVPCTPVALNTGLFWPRRSFLKRPGTVVIEFLPAIAPAPREDFMQALKNAMEPATAALVAETAADTEIGRVARNTPAAA